MKIQDKGWGLGENLHMSHYVWNVVYQKYILLYTGVSIKFEVGSQLKNNNRLYEQGGVRPINLEGSGDMLPKKILKSGGSEMPFQTFWAPNYHASTSGNYSVCMAIRCEIKFKKNIPASIAIFSAVNKFWSRRPHWESRWQPTFRVPKARAS